MGHQGISGRGVLLFVAMAMIWGVPYLMIRVAVRELTPATLVFSRTAIAALLLIPLAAARGELRPLLTRRRPFLLYTAVEVAIPWLLLARAETRLSSSLTGLLIAGVPLVGAVVVSVTGERERQGARRWLGLLIGIVGVAALVGLDLGQTSALALIEVAGVVVCYAVGPIILTRRLAGLPPLGVVAASLALTALVYAPIAVADRPTATPSAHVLESVLGLGLVCTALAFVLFFALIAEIGPVRATVINYVTPAVAALVGVTVLNEHVTGGMIVGFLLILAGCLLAAGRAPSPQTAAVAER